MAELIVEIHVPLVPSAVPARQYPFPWIDSVMEYLAELDGTSGEMYDDGEELGDEYVFFVSGARESDLLDIAKRVANLPGVPAGVHAVVTDAEAGMGEGRRIDME